MTTELGAEDDAILRRLAEGEHGSDPSGDSESIAAETGRSVEAVERTLSQLVEDGLVVPSDDGAYELTPSGRRVLQTSDDESRPDVPPEITRTVEGFDLDRDAEDALYRAVSFLRNWETATANEIVDAAYSEEAAGYDDGDDWWNGLIRERLADLPGVVPPSSEDGHWRYERADASAEGGRDGRQMLDSDDDQYGSARHAIERESESESEADALSAAFDALATRDRAATAELADAVDAETDAAVGFDRIADGLEAIPDVEREGDAWRYVGDERYWHGETSEE